MRPKLIIVIILFALFISKIASNVEANPNFRVENVDGNASSQKQGDPLEIPQLITALMKKLPVTPGLAIAVVRGDKIIFVRGFGYGNVKSKLPVTPQPGFYIASTTKSSREQPLNCLLRKASWISMLLS